MTREEKKQKLWTAILKETGSTCLESYIDRILDALEEQEPPKFRENEIVRCITSGRLIAYDEYRMLSRDNQKRAEKLSVKELAATAAPPNAVRWALKKNAIWFYDDAGYICSPAYKGYYRTYCPHDGEAEGELKR